MIAFLSDRRGLANLHVIPLQKPAVEGYKERPLLGGPDIDWEDIHLRAKAVAPVPAAEAAISPDGSKVAFRDGVQGDLWVASTSGGQLTRLTTGRTRPHYIQWSKRKSPFGGTLDVLYFLDGEGKLRMARASGVEAKPGDLPANSTNVVTLPFKIKMTIRTEELYNEMFDQSWRYLAEHFYDNKFHGIDWDSVRNRYRPLVKHVALKEDLYALLYLMMGELNASHLGISGFTTAPEEMTADLGLVFDPAYRGPGLKIQEILKRGPCDKRGLILRPNEYVLAIDDVELNDKTEVSKLLNGKDDEVVVLQVSSNATAEPKARRRVEVHPTSRQHVATLMYERWVENNSRRVAELSKGKLGYIHIPSMDEDGLDHFVRALYSDNFNKEAIVLDVRFNGGGYTHDQVLNYLGARQHTVFKQRDGGEGLVLVSSDRKWTKPLVLLINNQSFSDAEIFPNAFRTLGLGKLVGQPTGGFVIGTGEVRLIDGSAFRIPRIGVFTTQGINMDKEGVNPDVLVETHPDQLAKGIDAQLDKAVDVLNADLLAAKKPTAPMTGPLAPKVVAKPSDGKPMPTIPPTIP
jgi:tricorn protease